LLSSCAATFQQGIALDAGRTHAICAVDALDACWTRALCARMLPLTHRRGVKVLSNLSARGAWADGISQGRGHARGASTPGARWTHAGRAMNSGHKAGENEHSIDCSQNKVILVWSTCTTLLQTMLIRCSFVMVWLRTITPPTLKPDCALSHPNPLNYPVLDWVLKVVVSGVFSMWESTATLNTKQMGVKSGCAYAMLTLVDCKKC
jgi:hypothetical protein